MGLMLSSTARGEFGLIFLGEAAAASSLSLPAFGTHGDPPADDPSGILGIVAAALVTLAGPRYVDERLGSVADAMEF
jgi:hypothetical protein